MPNSRLCLFFSSTPGDLNSRIHSVSLTAVGHFFLPGHDAGSRVRSWHPAFPLRHRGVHYDKLNYYTAIDGKSSALRAFKHTHHLQRAEGGTVRVRRTEGLVALHVIAFPHLIHFHACPSVAGWIDGGLDGSYVVDICRSRSVFPCPKSVSPPPTPIE